MYQNDSIAFTEDKKTAICRCMCGTPEHGILVFDICHWKDQEGKLLEETFVSFCGSAWAGSFKKRLRNAWDAFMQRPIDIDLTLNGADAERLGKWLQENGVARTTEKEKIKSLKEVRNSLKTE